MKRVSYFLVSTFLFIVSLMLFFSFGSIPVDDENAKVLAAVFLILALLLILLAISELVANKRIKDTGLNVESSLVHHLGFFGILLGIFLLLKEKRKKDVKNEIKIPFLYILFSSIFILFKKGKKNKIENGIEQTDDYIEKINSFSKEFVRITYGNKAKNPLSKYKKWWF